LLRNYSNRKDYDEGTAAVPQEFVSRFPTLNFGPSIEDYRPVTQYTKEAAYKLYKEVRSNLGLYRDKCRKSGSHNGDPRVLQASEVPFKPRVFSGNGQVTFFLMHRP